MISILDFHFVGGTRQQAVAAMRKIYPSYSPARRLLRICNSLNQMGPRLVPHRLNSLLHSRSLPFPELRQGHMRGLLTHKLLQKGRVYIFDFTPEGRMTSVTKLATTEFSAKGLHDEAVNLRSIASRSDIMIPELLAYVDCDGGAMLQLSAAPEGFQPHDKTQPIPEALFRHIRRLAAPSVPAKLPASAFPGWTEIAPQISEPSLCAVAAGIEPDRQFATGAAHGDLGSENLFSRQPANTPADYFLIDWEFFASTAPELTDCVGLWLGGHHRDLKGIRSYNQARLADQFLKDFEAAHGGREAALLALIYLTHIGIDLAHALIGNAGKSRGRI